MSRLFGYKIHMKGDIIMKKLGKKIVNSQETIETYCGVCSRCGCSCSCPSCNNPGYDSQLAQASSAISSSRNSSNTSAASNSRQF